MKLSSIFGLACLVLGPVTALVGLDTDMYNPPCAHACSSAIASSVLSCSSHGAVGGHMHGDSAMTSPLCRASNTAFITTLAWCMSTKCASYHIPVSELETFWEKYCTGDPAVAPKWDYGTALQHVVQPINRVLTLDETLNATSLVPHDSWNIQYNTLTFLEAKERLHAKYGYISYSMYAIRPNVNLLTTGLESSSL